MGQRKIITQIKSDTFVLRSYGLKGGIKNIVMKEKREDKQRRILNALLSGMRLTPDDANKIGKTTEGTRMIRKIRETFPVLKVQVAGVNYYQYYIDPEWLAEYRKGNRKPMGERIGDFFDDLFKGGMFEG